MSSISHKESSSSSDAPIPGGCTSARKQKSSESSSDDDNIKAKIPLWARRNIKPPPIIITSSPKTKHHSHGPITHRESEEKIKTSKDANQARVGTNETTV